MLPYSREVFVTLQGGFMAAHPWLVALGCLLFLASSVGVLGAPRPGTRATALLLAVLWCAAGVFWYARFWSDIDFLGPVYATIALTQALAMAVAAIPGGKNGTVPPRWFPATCTALALAYPVFDSIFGPGWPAVRVPSVYPEPLLLLSAAAIPVVGGRYYRILLVPALLLAGATGYRAAVLSMPQDWLVPVLTLVAVCQPRKERECKGPRP